jgi:hypothetical protein
MARVGELSNELSELAYTLSTGASLDNTKEAAGRR